MAPKFSKCILHSPDCKVFDIPRPTENRSAANSFILENTVNRKFRILSTGAQMVWKNSSNATIVGVARVGSLKPNAACKSEFVYVSEKT